MFVKLIAKILFTHMCTSRTRNSGYAILHNDVRLFNDPNAFRKLTERYFCRHYTLTIIILWQTLSRRSYYYDEYVVEIVSVTYVSTFLHRAIFVSDLLSDDSMPSATVYRGQLRNIYTISIPKQRTIQSVLLSAQFYSFSV